MQQFYISGTTVPLLPNFNATTQTQQIQKCYISGIKDITMLQLKNHKHHDATIQAPQILKCYKSTTQEP